MVNKRSVICLYFNLSFHYYFHLIAYPSQPLFNNNTVTVPFETTFTDSAPQTKSNRFSFGLDLTENTLDCSIELCDLSVASNSIGPVTATSPVSSATSSMPLRKQHSFDRDESLGIFTPDQLNDFLDSNHTNPSNADLLLNFRDSIHNPFRIDQTPSPEELPLDPISSITTDPTVVQSYAEDTDSYQHHLEEQNSSQTDSSDSKADQMTKSTASKVSCFITSITSITSLDTGYQGDGEMSRPASRGAGAHSPSGVARAMQHIIPRDQHHVLPPIDDRHADVPMIVARRTADSMTDSDFFTESDADDVANRGGAGDRRAQIIDGHLYDGAGGEIEAGANVFIGGGQRHRLEGGESMTEDSCMESSGIFTDVENRGDEELGQLRSDPGGPDERDELSDDMSPNGSTDTIKSNTAEYNAKQKTTSTVKLLMTIPANGRDGPLPQGEFFMPNNYYIDA